MSFKISEVNIGKNNKPFIIAEMSGNHNQSLDTALLIVDAIADSGAHALKLQTYTADTMTLDLSNDEFYISDENSLWHGSSLYDLYKRAYTPWEWHKPIFDRAKARGLIAFSTPFDETAVDFLESLNVPAYKIASFENIDLRLIKKVAATNKPVIISTGMATLAEIDDAVTAARSAGCMSLALLKCTSSYPADASNANIASIPHLRDAFNCEVGLSDHTLGIGVAIASVALGATIIEKHVTLNRNDGGVDAEFSLEPHELKQLVIESSRAALSIGSIYIGPTASEKNSLVFRRTLYIAKDLKKGDILTHENLKAIRPGLGLAPKYYDMFISKKVSKDVKKGTPLAWEHLS